MLKTTFALAVLAMAVSADDKTCAKVEKKVMKYTEKAEKRVDKTQERIDKKVEKFVEIFNDDELNAARTGDITASELQMFLEEEVAMEISAGTWEASDFWDREIDDKDCDVDDAVAAYLDAVDDARDKEDVWRYMTKKEGPVEEDPEAYFTCANSLFASETWCTL